jgi:hypothetical protein
MGLVRAICCTTWSSFWTGLAAAAFPAVRGPNLSRSTCESENEAPILRVHMPSLYYPRQFFFSLSSPRIFILRRQQSNSLFSELKHRKSLSADWHITNSSFLFSD